MFRAAVLLALPLVACAPEGNTSISIENEGGNISFSSDESGRAEIKAPGFEGTINLPKIDIDAADFEMNGVKLYPGSRISAFDLKAAESEGRDSGKVAVRFEAPASLDKVQAWFRDAMAKQGFKVTPAGNGFAGTTDKGEPVTLELEAGGPEKTSGRISAGS